MKTHLTWFLTSQLYNEVSERVQELTGVRKDHIIHHYLYTTHKIITHKSFYSRFSDYNGCPVNTTSLGSLFGKTRKEVAKILNNLQQWGIITKTRNYFVGDHSNHYMINEDNFNISRVTVETFTNDFNISFMAKLMAKTRVSDQKFCKKSLESFNKNITLSDAGKEYLSTKYGSSMLQTLLTVSEAKDKKLSIEIDFQDISLIQIAKKEFYVKRPDPKSRVYSNLTNLPVIHRKYISFNDKPLLFTDIKNSQILLSVPQIKNYYKMIKGKAFTGYPQDIKDFQKICEEGQFYEIMAEACGVTFNDIEDRQEFKKTVFAKIWFSRNTNKLPKEKKVFKGLFPNVFDIITRIKKDDYTAFAIGLQKTEARIIIDTVAKELLRLGKDILTLHDSIVCSNENDLILAENLIIDALTPDGITPAFKRESVIEVQEELLQEAIAIINNPYEPIEVSEFDGDTVAVFNINNAIINVIYYSIRFEPLLNALNDSDTQILFDQFITSQEGLNELVINNISIPVQKLTLENKEIAIELR